MKSIYLILILSLFILPLVNANQGVTKVNECFNIRILENCTSVNLVEVTNSAVPITYELNTAMQQTGQTFNYTFCNTSDLGTYSFSWDPNCRSCSSGNCGNSFLVTPNGQDFSIAQSYLFIGFLLLLILFLIGGIWGMAKALNGSWQIAYICLAYLSLFSIFFVSWLYSSNYLWSTPILASIFWILWLILAFGFFPFILIVGTYIIGKGLKDNLFKQYKAQGYTDEEAKDMANKKSR